jgi:HK97 family phage portal protein
MPPFLLENLMARFRRQEARALGKNPFNLAIDDDYSSDTAGMKVDADSALTLSAVYGAIRLLAEDIGGLPIDAYRKRTGKRELIDPAPSWIEAPLPLDPSVTSSDHFSQVVASMVGMGEGISVVLPNVSFVGELHVLDPRNVEVSRTSRGVPVYKPTDGDFKGSEFGPDQIIHVPLFRKPGALRGLSPIEAMAQGIGRGMAAQDMGSRIFSQGAWMKALVEYPIEAGEVTPEQVEELLRRLEKRHRGKRNAWTLGALTGGAKLHELMVKPSDLQMIESEEWTLEQFARTIGIPPSMLGSQKPGAVAYASVEQRSIDYVVHAVLPILGRIEKAYSRLLPRGSYIKFNVNGLLRGDQAARWAAYHIALQDKVYTRDEVRQLEDKEPFGGEDGGFLETPNNNPPDAGVANASQE